MKKIAFALLTLLLTATFLYNVIGYQLMFSLKKEQKWVAAMQKIPDSKFKVLRLNATLYSFIDDTEMEIVNENFIYKNTVLKFFFTNSMLLTSKGIDFETMANHIAPNHSWLFANA